jgi:hypothetical protein
MIRQRNFYAMRINLPPRERCFSGSVGNPPQFLMMVHPLRGRIADEPLRQAPFPSIVAQHVIFK